MPVLKQSSFFCSVPVISLLEPDSGTLLVRACEDLGFFKVTNHGIPPALIASLEEEAMQFFALPAADKELAGKANPFGYGSKSIGSNGDVGWVEYLLMEITSNSKPLSMDFLQKPSASSFR